MLFIAAAMPAYAAQEAIDHGPWDRLLRRYVTSGLVDYAALGQEREALDAYVKSLRQVAASQLPSREAQLAFWINAYNAVVVRTVLDRGSVESVKGIHGFFDRLKHPIAGTSLTLNAIEDRARALGDWRIHMALVCASLSCPPLRSEAYVPERLEAQLAEQTQHFLADSSRGLRLDRGRLWVSKIFTWYAKDFGLREPIRAEELLAVIRSYLEPMVAASLEGKPLKVQLMDYDWSLNARRR